MSKVVSNTSFGDKNENKEHAQDLFENRNMKSLINIHHHNKSSDSLSEHLDIKDNEIEKL